MSAAREFCRAELQALSPYAKGDERDGLRLRAILGMGISPHYGDTPDSFLLGELEDLCADLDDLVNHVSNEDPTVLRNGVDRLQRRARMALALIPRLEAAEQAASANEVAQ